MTNSRTSTETASGLGKKATDSIEEFGRSAARKMDEVQGETGEALHAAASSVRATGRQGADAIDNLANSTADRLDATASYIEHRDVRDVYNRVRRFARRHPTRSLLAAAAIGFLAGSTISRVTHLR